MWGDLNYAADNDDNSKMAETSFICKSVVSAMWITYIKTKG